MSQAVKERGNGLAAPPEAIPPEVARYAGLVRVRMTLQGVTPLMMNAMSVDELLNIRSKKKAARTAAKPSLREEAESGLHRLPDGRPHVPVNCLYGTFINAGQFIRLDGKRQVSTAQRTILPGMLSLLDTELLLFRHDGVTAAAWEIDIRQGRNPNGGEAVCLVRPRFDEWQFDCTIEVDQEQMPLPMARDLVDIAGRRIGLLEYSPRRKGIFGRFNVARWEVIPTAP